MTPKFLQTRPPNPNKNYICKIPQELLIHVLSYLSSWDYLSPAHTSYGYRTFIHENAREICLAAMRAQPDLTAYTMAITIDKHDYLYFLRLGWFFAKKWFRKYRSAPRFWEPVPMPVFIGYLEQNGRDLEPKMSSAYARHILGELIEIGWMKMGGLKHRRSKGVKTVTINLEGSYLTRRWCKVWVEGPLLPKIGE